MTFELRCCAHHIFYVAQSCRRRLPTASFFTELADVLDRVSTFADPLVLAEDLNLRLERQQDPHTVEFNNLLAGYSLHQQVAYRCDARRRRSIRRRVYAQ